MKKYIYFLLFMQLIPDSLRAQQTDHHLLYEQTSEMGSTISFFQQDIKAVQDFYSPYVTTGLYPRTVQVYRIPEQRTRLLKVYLEYQQKMKQMDFEGFSIHAKVDYLLLQKEIESGLQQLEQEEKIARRLETYLPFAPSIYALEKSRRRGQAVVGADVADAMNKISGQVMELLASLKSKPKLEEEMLKELKSAIGGLKSRLLSFYEFYQGYDPAFSWWVPKPYSSLVLALDDYAATLTSAGKVGPESSPADYGIKGRPIGEAALLSQLKKEFIPYSPEELLKIAEKEFAFCDAELLKASQEMGYGKDWKSAQEKVKQSYVSPGKQAELIVELQQEALDFIAEHELMSIPALAEETWGMVMMSEERQLVNPFFTGGREISISYPTSGMSEADKRMSMRGNNQYFSRATVQHELLPGHHLQYYMNSRYKSYRKAFSTPFGVEGWTLYWELLLYDKGFAKSPEERIGMLFWRMHRCARIIFSLNYHLGKWPPGQCVDFLVDRVGHESANAIAEVKRSFEGGYSPLYQLAYMIGGLQLMSMQRELVGSGQMSYKEFHERVMKENLIPMELLRATLINQSLRRDFTTQWRFYH